MKLLIPFLIAIFIHLIFFLSWNAIYKPANIYFKHGESAIQMMLVASIDSPEMEKGSTLKEDSKEGIVETVYEAKNQLDTYEEIESIQPEAEIKDEKLVNDIVSDKGFTDNENDVSKNSSLFTNESDAAKKQIAEGMIQPEKSEEEIDSSGLSVEHEDSKEATMPSREEIADLLEKGIREAVISGIEKPEYPLSCRKNGHEGTVILEVTIDKNGSCIGINLVQSAGCSSLDKSARKSLKNARFNPAERFGIKISSTKKIAFRFKIKEID